MHHLAGRRAWLPAVGLTIAILIWSSNNIVGKIILREASPMTVAVMRFSLAGLLFYLPVFLVLHRGEQRFSKQEWPRLVFLGVVGTSGSLVLYLTGLRTTPALEAGIYQITAPVITLILAWLWFGERLTRKRVPGLALASVGAALLVGGGGAAGFGGGDLTGALFILACNVTWALYTLMSKAILARRSPLLLLAATNLIAAIAIWPIAALFGALPELPSVLRWSPDAWMIMAYLIIFMSTTSQWIYLRCLREIDASQVASFNNLMPVFTGIQAALFLGEEPTLLALSAGLLTLGGVWLVNRPSRPRQRQRETPAAAPGAAAR